MNNNIAWGNQHNPLRSLNWFGGSEETNGSLRRKHATWFEPFFYINVAPCRSRMQWFDFPRSQNSLTMHKTAQYSIEYWHHPTKYQRWLRSLWSSVPLRRRKRLYYSQAGHWYDHSSSCQPELSPHISRIVIWTLRRFRSSRFVYCSPDCLTGNALFIHCLKVQRNFESRQFRGSLADEGSRDLAQFTLFPGE